MCSWLNLWMQNPRIWKVDCPVSLFTRIICVHFNPHSSDAGSTGSTSSPLYPPSHSFIHYSWAAVGATEKNCVLVTLSALRVACCQARSRLGANICSMGCCETKDTSMPISSLISKLLLSQSLPEAIKEGFSEEVAPEQKLDHLLPFILFPLI